VARLPRRRFDRPCARFSARIKDTLFRLSSYGPLHARAGHASVHGSDTGAEPISLKDVDRLRDSPAYQQLLAEFVAPNSPDAVERSPRWKEVFREPVRLVLRELQTLGILIEATDPRARICFDRDESELRMLCLEYGLPTMGSADQLADRLLAVDPTGWLLGYAGELLQCAESAVRASPRLPDPDVGELFTQGDFDAKRHELQDRRESAPSDNEVIWRMLKERAERNAREGDLRRCRDVHLAMANHLIRRKNPVKALQAHCVVCVFDLCGVRNRSDAPLHARKTYSRFDAARTSLAPWLVTRISDLSRESALPMDETRNVFLGIAKRLRVPKDSQKLWAVVKLALDGRLEVEDENARNRAIQELLS
jgi:hypothetical protein